MYMSESPSEEMLDFEAEFSFSTTERMFPALACQLNLEQMCLP